MCLLTSTAFYLIVIPIHWVNLISVVRSDEDSDYEITDQDVNKILIVTQTPPAVKKHPQGDRTGDHVSRAKMTANMTKVINDGLFYYEQDLHESLEVRQLVKAPQQITENIEMFQTSMTFVVDLIISQNSFRRYY